MVSNNSSNSQQRKPQMSNDMLYQHKHLSGKHKGAYLRKKHMKTGLASNCSYITDEAREQELSNARSVFIPCDFLTHIRMCLVPPHMLSKTHQKQSNKCWAYNSPYVTVGRTGQRQVFSTTQLLRWKFVLTWLSYSLKVWKLHAPVAS